MLGDFAINLEPIKSSPLEQTSLLDEFVLETHLDLSQHPAHKTIDLPKQYVFNSISKFRHVVAADEACVLYLLACMVRYNVTKHSRMNKRYAQWKQLN